MSEEFDAIVIGAGAAGMFCAAHAARRGLRLALLDHWPRLGEKIRISGGGRCNFTNREAHRIDRFEGENPAFARTALRAYPPARFLGRLAERGIGWHEKHKGQLFCDDSSQSIISMLRDDCDAAGVRWFRPVKVGAVERAVQESEARACRWRVRCEAGDLGARSVVIATGGLSIPKVGASDLALRVARRLGLRVVPPRPALVPLTFEPDAWRAFSDLAGVALPVVVRAPAASLAPAFEEDLLFTHRGLSGPAVLQISTFWRPGDPISIDLAAGRDLASALREEKRTSRQQLSTVLATLLPRRLAARWLADARFAALASRRLAEVSDRDLAALAAVLGDWWLVPSGSEGWRKAEVMAGGVATDELDARSLQSHRAPGLHFIGEAVDITGWLGGYNFQWAWASAYLAGEALAASAA